MDASRVPSDRKTPGKALDGRKNYNSIQRRVWTVYASPEEALSAWKRDMCGASEKTKKIIKRSIKAGRPLVVTILQQERSPDGRVLNIPILTIDTRVTRCE